jgi:hypothetical protein
MSMALLLLHGGALLAAWALLWWRDHAAVTPWLHWRRKPALPATA